MKKQKQTGDIEMYVKIQIGENNNYVLEEARGAVSYRSEKMKMSLGDYRLLADGVAITSESRKTLTKLENELCDFFCIKDDFEIEYAIAPEGDDDSVVELRHVLVNELHYVTPHRIYITNNQGQTCQAI